MMKTDVNSLPSTRYPTLPPEDTRAVQDGGRRDLRSVDSSASAEGPAGQPQAASEDAGDGLTKTSAVWVNYQHGINLAEMIEPGSSKRMTREQLIAYPGKMSAEATTPGQEALIASTRIAPALDWAVANGILAKKNDYSKDDIHKAASALDLHLEEMAKAITSLTTPMPMRKNYFTGTQWVSPIAGHNDPDNKKYPTALYDDKRFADDFKADLANKKKAYGVLIKQLISTLSPEDRIAIEHGAVSTYALKPPGDKDDLERGSFLIKAVYKGKTTIYEIDPARGIARKHNNYAGVFNGSSAIGQKKLEDGSYSKEFSVWDKPSLQGAQYQPRVDRQSGLGPNNEVFHAKLYTLEPLGKFSDAEASSGEQATPQSLSSKRSNEIANNISEKLFYAKDLDLLYMAEEDPERVTQAEKDDRENYKEFSASRDKRREFLKGFVPFWHGIEAIIAGRPIEGVAKIWVDLLSFTLPVGEVASSLSKGAVRAVKSAFPPLSTFTKKMLGFTRSPGVSGVKWEGGVQGIKWAGNAADDIGKGVKQFRLNTAPLSRSDAGIREIEFNGSKYFAADKPDAGDGTHYLLRVPDPKDPSKLVSSSTVAKPNEAGVWEARVGSSSTPSSQNRIDGWKEYLFGENWQPVDPFINDKFRVKMDNAKYGPDSASYERGYNSGSPDSVDGYYKGMKSSQIKELALKPERTSEQIGVLVRVLEKRKAGKSLEDFLHFKSEVEAAGGTAKGMPQNLYLSEVDVLSNGECAALSNSMALAISQGKEDVLIANLYKATAASKDPKILNFRKNLSTLHDNVAYSFHGGQPVKRMTYKDIIGELGNATVTTTFKISDKGHGVIAGVIVENNNKSFFFYDPNFGLAKFPTQQAMEKALESLLNSGKVGSTFKPFGADRAMPEYDVSVFSDSDFYVQSGSINPNSFFDQPL